MAVLRFLPLGGELPPQLMRNNPTLFLSLDSDRGQAGDRYGPKATAIDLAESDRSTGGLTSHLRPRPQMGPTF